MIDFKNKNLSAFIVPTGVGASIGGFAGDASLYAKKISEKVPIIVNPNVVNAACFSGINNNMLYTEGAMISEFFKGNISLNPSVNNEIGVIFDQSISPDLINIHINVINAVKTVYGINVMGYEITDEPCGVEFFMTEAGISSGAVLNNKTLLRAAKKLITRGADAIAVVCHFDEPPSDEYKHGNSPDIIGGVEAIISHYLSKELLMPVVHAPAFEKIEITGELVDARAAAEYITPTFLPCLLLGLQNAPQIIPELNEKYLTVNDIFSVIAPYNSLGSPVVLDAVMRKINIFAIKENNTVLNVDKYALSLENGIINMNSYDDCFDFINEVV